MIEGAESPVGSSRSVVVLALRDRTATEKFLAAFLGRSQSGQIAKSVSLLRGERFVSYRAGNEVYHVGALSPRLKMRLAIEEFPWLMVVLTFAAAFLMAIVVRVTLRKMARERLLVTA
jgi:cellulose synthase (UDP-forming)